MVADTETQTREDDYMARSEKLTLLKKYYTLLAHVHTAVLLG